MNDNEYCVVRATKRCNHHCRFCFINELNKVDDISIDEIVNDIPLTTKKIYITGGEVTLRNDLLEMILRIKERINGIRIIIQTNGTYNHFKDNKDIHNLIDQYHFSIHTLDKKFNKYITQNDDDKALDTLIENIMFAKENKKMITTNTCLPVKGNHLIETIEGISNLPVDHYNLSFIIGYKKDFPDFYQNWEEIDFEKIVSILNNKNKSFSFEGFPECVLPMNKNISLIKTYEEHYGIERTFEEKISKKYKTVAVGSYEKIYLEQCENCSKLNKCAGFEKNYFDAFGEENVSRLINRAKGYLFE